MFRIKAGVVKPFLIASVFKAHLLLILGCEELTQFLESEYVIELSCRKYFKEKIPGEY